MIERYNLGFVGHLGHGKCNLLLLNLEDLGLSGAHFNCIARPFLLLMMTESLLTTREGGGNNPEVGLDTTYESI